ncbi:unnamed protein product [Caenorhabditis sp. 36 PRJEB53466]|nr:unnamed protein product [Caenorhabditis sp. 36 PRJEB53466]
MRVRILLLTSAFLTSTLANGPLTYAENDERLEKCGRQFLNYQTGTGINYDKTVLDSDIKHLWLVGVSSQYSPTHAHRTNMSLGSIISKRHVITSSQVVIGTNVTNETLVWAYNGEAVNPTGEDCDERGNMPVPKEVTELLVLRAMWCEGETLACKYKSFAVERAWILNLCGRERSYHKEASPFLLELKADEEEIKYPCLINASTVLPKLSRVDAFGLLYKQEMHRVTMYAKNAAIHSFTDDKKFMILTDHQRLSFGDRGGPLIRNDSETVILVGINADGALLYPRTYYWDLRLIQEDFKRFAGIHNEFKGQPPSSTSTALPSTSTPSSTVAPPPDTTTFLPTSTAPPPVPSAPSTLAPPPVPSDPPTVAAPPPTTPQPTEPVNQSTKSTKQTKSAPKEPAKATDVPRKEGNDGEKESDDLFVSEEFLNKSTAKSVLILFALSFLIQ